MSSHIEYGRKRCADGQCPLPFHTWDSGWDNGGSFRKSFYANKSVFSGTSPKQVPQPIGEIYRKREER